MRNKTLEKTVRKTIYTCWECGKEEAGNDEGSFPQGWFCAGVSKTDMGTSEIDLGWKGVVSHNSRFCSANCLMKYLSIEVK